MTIYHTLHGNSLKDISSTLFFVDRLLVVYVQYLDLTCLSYLNYNII